MSLLSYNKGERCALLNWQKTPHTIATLWLHSNLLFNIITEHVKRVSFAQCFHMNMYVGLSHVWNKGEKKPLWSWFHTAQRFNHPLFAYIITTLGDHATSL